MIQQLISINLGIKYCNEAHLNFQSFKRRSLLEDLNYTLSFVSIKQNSLDDHERWYGTGNGLTSKKRLFPQVTR